jgi:hypothetical protein
MTVKYLDLLVSMDMLGSYKNMIEKNKRKYHIPIDSYILSSLWRDSDTDLKEKFPSKIDCNHDFSKVTTWSNWDNYDDTYLKFKNNVIGSLKGKDIDPFDYENKIWIKEAKQVKKRETEDRINSFFDETILNTKKAL